MWNILTEDIHLNDMRLIIEFLIIIIVIYIFGFVIDNIRQWLFKPISRISVGNEIDLFVNENFKLR